MHHGGGGGGGEGVKELEEIVMCAYYIKSEQFTPYAYTLRLSKELSKVNLHGTKCIFH